MKLADCRDAYYDYSAKASQATRVLALGGIAVAWVFRAGEGEACRLPPGIILPLVFFGLSLMLDLLHAIAGTAAWGIYARFREKTGTSETAEFQTPAWLNWPLLAFFWLKIIAVFIGHIFLVMWLWGRLLAA